MLPIRPCITPRRKVATTISFYAKPLSVRQWRIGAQELRQGIQFKHQIIVLEARKHLTADIWLNGKAPERV